MAQITVILLILHYIRFFLRGGSDVLLCGIWGFSSNHVKNWNPLTKFQFELLGVEMDTRGGDSCGIAYDNTVLKSEEVKKFDDLWRTGSVPNKLDYPAIIGHDRKASIGVKSYDNAQPIFFPDTRDPVSSILAHNGTLHNHEELYEKHKADAHYKLDTKGMSDSQMLCLLIERVGWSILNEYNGAAAFLYMNTSEPGVIYAYHGKSATRAGVVIETEERPLYYAIDNDNIWFCSTRFALEKIIADKKKIVELPFNKVFRIEGSSMSEVFTVNRSKCHQFDAIVTTYGSNYKASTYATYDDDSDGYGGYWAAGWNEKNKNKNKAQTQLELYGGGKNIPLALSNLNTDSVYSGCMRWCKGIFVCDEIALHGLVTINRSGRLAEKSRSYAYDNNFSFYFWRGNLVKGRDEYIAIIEYYDANVGKASEMEILQVVAKHFVLPYMIPKIIGGNDDVLYSTEVSATGKKCEWRFNGVIQPAFCLKEFTFRGGQAAVVAQCRSYNGIDCILKYNEKWPDEFYSWLKDHDQKILDAANPKAEESKVSEMCQCPDCMGTSFDGVGVCSTCDGEGELPIIEVQIMMSEIEEMATYIMVITEEEKVRTALTEVIESGIDMLEEPDMKLISTDMLNKLITIKKVLGNDRTVGSNV